MPVTFRREGPVAYVELDNAPVNAISQEIRQGLIDAVDQVRGTPGLDRVILSGKHGVFAAGADAREFDLDPIPPHLPDVIKAIETSPVPWIAAIDGFALGGGYELAMGCRYRIAAPKAQLGLPEVTLGLVPGAGGTQRLPRLVGLGPALKLIATGKPVKGPQALAIGLIDMLADDPIQSAENLALSQFSTRHAVSELPGPAADETLLANARTLAARKAPRQIAPPMAIDLIAMTCATSFEQGLQQERATFMNLRGREQARALRHIFFAERSARLPQYLKSAVPTKLSHVAVVGGGTMGAGIAYALLNAGLQVTLLETGAAPAEQARRRIENTIAASLKRDLITSTDAARYRGQLICSEDYAQARSADLVIEAAFESMEVKKSIFSQLQTATSPDTILATNTSYLDIDEIAGVLDDPTRLLGLHFFAPAHIMRLLEIVKGAKTSDAALALGFTLAKQLRKVPVLSGVCDGFIGNRILARYREAAEILLLEGAMPQQVDAAMREFGYAMGLFETNDLSGLDIGYANRRRQDATRDPNRRYVRIADQLVEAGRLGRKSGAGWYSYTDGQRPDPQVADMIAQESHAAGVARREFSATEISRTLLLAMINEAADILDEGIASSARDIDLVTVFGYGFPRWRGGLMHYADELGPATILAELETLADSDPLIWRPSPLIRRCVLQDIAFAKATPA